MTTLSLFVALTFLYLVQFERISASKDSHADFQNDERSGNTPDPLMGYVIDVCAYAPEVNIACQPNYIVSEITTEYGPWGSCGCFRLDIVNMSKFLNSRCLGSVSCKANDIELKSYDMYNPTSNCGSVRKIRYNCEPAQSLCKNGIENAVSSYSSHINLLSPNYPNSYPGNQRPPLVCALEISLKPDYQVGTSNPKMKIISVDTNLLSGEYVSVCDEDTLHVGATLDELGPEYQNRCYVAASSFLTGTKFEIVYHYHHNPYEFRRGVFLKITGVGPRSTIKVKHIDYEPVTLRPTTTPTKSLRFFTTTQSNTQQRRQFPSQSTQLPEKSDENYGGSNTTNIETPVLKQRYKGPLLTFIIVGTVLLVLLVFLLAVLCLWRRRHSSWKSAMSHMGIYLGCKKSRTMSINEPPTRLSSRPSSGSTINPYAYSAATYPPAAGNQYSEPLNVYVNTDNQRSSNGCRNSDIYDDVQAQRDGLFCKEPPYDNHIIVQAMKQKELEKCPLKHSDKYSHPSTSHGKVGSIEDLYSKPTPFKKRYEDDGYDSGHSTTSVPLQEGENLLVENEIYHSKNNPTS